MYRAHDCMELVSHRHRTTKVDPFFASQRGVVPVHVLPFLAAVVVPRVVRGELPGDVEPVDEVGREVLSLLVRVLQRLGDHLPDLRALLPEVRVQAVERLHAGGVGVGHDLVRRVAHAPVLLHLAEVKVQAQREVRGQELVPPEEHAQLAGRDSRIDAPEAAAPEQVHQRLPASVQVGCQGALLVSLPRLGELWDKRQVSEVKTDRHGQVSVPAGACGWPP